MSAFSAVLKVGSLSLGAAVGGRFVLDLGFMESFGAGAIGTIIGALSSLSKPTDEPAPDTSEHLRGNE